VNAVQASDHCAEQREEETNWCFHGFVAFHHPHTGFARQSC
jgi:hypothetical protein